MTDRVRLLRDAVEKADVECGRRLDILSGLSFNAGAGEVVALTGPSGSGKSTVINLALGLDTPDAGAVSLMGVDLSTAPAARIEQTRWPHAGVVSQDFELIPELTALENVRLDLLPRGFGRRASWPQSAWRKTQLSDGTTR